jgi:hypothetical protein
MDLIERYLQAVQFWLPKQQKVDIITELSEDLHAQIEEKEASLGRPLSTSEVESILKKRGRPVVVANQFFPQQHLIGPMLYPVYIFVLKMAMLGYLIPWALIWIGMMIYMPSYRESHLAHGWLAVIAQGWDALWATAFTAAATVTLVFAILERVEARTHFLKFWEPRKLPALRNPTLIPRPASSIEVIANLVAITCWSHLHPPIVLHNPDVRIALAPVWLYFYWGFLILAFVNVALANVNLARPYWTAPRATIRLLADLAGGSLFCWLLKANVLIGISVATVSPERTQQIASAINFWMAKAFPVSILVVIGIACADIYRIWRLKSPSAQLALQAVSTH